MPVAKELATLKELKAALKAAKTVLVMPRFGTSEAWVPITKATALKFVTETVAPGATPESCEMYGGTFGTYYPEYKELLLG
jgi:hypothetical protein